MNNPAPPAGDPPLLAIANLHVAFRADGQEISAVRGAALEIYRGETVALVGESGSGKSVTALSALRLLPPAALPPQGSVRFKGEELLTASESRLREIRGNRVGFIFQEPMTSLNPLQTVERQVGEVLLIHGRATRSELRARVIALLERVGLADATAKLASYPHQLSGGQRQRVMIAIALANEPDLLIADEPTTALDVTIQAQILALLARLKSELGMGLLLITHDLNTVRKVADRVYVMKDGEMVEAGKVAQVFAAPKHSYSRHLIASEPKGAPVPAAPEAPIVLEGADVKVWFPIRKGILRRVAGHVKAVDGISIAIREGQTLGVVGESGSGKTTLGLAVLRLVEAQGRVVFLSRQVDALDAKALRGLRKDMQIVFQDPFGSLSPRMPVGDVVAEGLSVHGQNLGEEARRARIARALTEVGLDPSTQDRYPHEFSGGQRQRIAIARALILEPKFLVLDEPTSALDMSVQAQIVDLLRDLQARLKLSYLFISHDLKVVRALAHDVLVMRDGRIVEQGPAAQIFERPEAPYTRALMAAAFSLDVQPMVSA